MRSHPTRKALLGAIVLGAAAVATAGFAPEVAGSGPGFWLMDAVSLLLAAAGGAMAAGRAAPVRRAVDHGAGVVNDHMVATSVAAAVRPRSDGSSATAAMPVGAQPGPRAVRATAGVTYAPSVGRQPGPQVPPTPPPPVGPPATPAATATPAAPPAAPAPTPVPQRPPVDPVSATLVPARPAGLPTGRWRPDSVLDGADLDDFAVRAASVRGMTQRRKAGYRSDGMLVEQLPGVARALLSAVASGARGNPDAHVAAELAVRDAAFRLGTVAATLGQVLVGQPDQRHLDELLVTVMRGVAGALREADGPRGAPLVAELTCLVSPTGRARPRRHLVFGVGGGAALRLRGGQWERVFPVGDTASAGGGAGRPSLPAAPEAVRWAFVDTLPGDALVLCTGATARAMSHPTAQSALREHWHAGPPHLAAYLWQLDAVLAATPEDRTAIGLWEADGASL